MRAVKFLIKLRIPEIMECQLLNISDLFWFMHIQRIEQQESRKHRVTPIPGHSTPLRVARTNFPVTTRTKQLHHTRNANGEPCLFFVPVRSRSIRLAFGILTGVACRVRSIGDVPWPDGDFAVTMAVTWSTHRSKCHRRAGTRKS